MTGRKRREADLRMAAAAFESHESMIITDAQAVILRVNHAFSDLFGYTAEEALGQTPRLLQSGRHEPAFYAALWAGIKNAHAWQGEIWNRRKNGGGFPGWPRNPAAARSEAGAGMAGMRTFSRTVHCGRR